MKIGGEKHPWMDACSSMFMRVRRTVPQFTFGFSARFVNRISSVSTGFFGFLPVLCGFWFILGQKASFGVGFWGDLWTPMSRFWVRGAVVERRIPALRCGMEMLDADSLRE
ncbi:hypothetical protein [Edaphobacter dinghuensis]|uniref:hypothetical protein n=1 Tax=Edaphobacter dinghuensis TaxID=1560005 RepID=UPI00166AF5BF|nr:hypothetical protein [Edaphobacter dinghuensis]